jgi:hypothetical protein
VSTPAPTRTSAPTLPRAFQGAIAANVVQLALALLNSVLLVRCLGAAPAGHYILWLALMAVGPVMLSAFDQLTTRFHGEYSPAARSRLAAGVLVGKLLAGVLIAAPVAVAAMSIRTQSGDAPGTSAPLLAAMLVNFHFAPLVAGWLNRLLATHLDYKHLLLVETGQALLGTLWMLIALVAAGSENLTLLVFGLSCISCWWIHLRWQRLKRLNPYSCLRLAAALRQPLKVAEALFTKAHRSYCVPFLITSFSAFLKDSLPLLAVGLVTSTVAVAEFRVVQQIFRTVHGLVPNAFELLRPALLQVKDQEPRQDLFYAKYNSYARLYIAGSVAFSIAVLASLPLIIGLWGLHFSAAVSWTAAILALELLYGSALHIEYQLFLLRERVGYLVVMSLARQAITLVATAWGAGHFAQPGAALGVAAGALFGWSGFAVHSLLTAERPRRHVLETAALGGLGTAAILLTAQLVAYA